MKIAVISDIHIEDDNDKSHHLLKAFFDHPTVDQVVTDIFLLGDIFDFLCGDYSGYLDLYPNFFNELKTIMGKGKKIHVFEGNHDFHLSKLFKRFFSDEYKSGLLKIYRKSMIMNLGERKFYFSHGDFLYIGDFSYKVYLFFIKNYLTYLFLRSVLNFKRVLKIGLKETKKSKYNREVRTTNFDELREVYRNAIQKFDLKKKADIYILGHSHIRDIFQWKNKNKNKVYLNNGFLPHSKSFLLLSEEEFKFVSLYDSECSTLEQEEVFQ